MTEELNIQSVRQLNVLIKISQNVIGTLEYEKVMQIISDGMSELFEIETAAIYLFEKNNLEMRLMVTTPPLPPDLPNDFRKLKLEDHPHIKKVTQARKPFFLEDINSAKLSLAEKEVCEMRNLRSLVYLPFVQEDVAFGVLILGTCDKPRHFTEHEINVGQTVANQLSVAIQNAKFFQDLEDNKDNLEKLVKEKTEDLDAAIEELRSTNEELYEKNEIINNQNSELRATLQHLKEAQSQLMQAEKMASLGTLTAGVSHELNNPLNYIMGACSGLENYFEEYGYANEKLVKQLINSIKTGIERSTNIISGLNQFSRNNNDFNEDCDIHLIIDNCLLMLNNQIKHKANIIKKYNGDSLRIKGNVGKLHQVFLNILSNSVYAIDCNGEITVTTHQDSKGIKVEISDNGCGIHEKDLNNITDPFYTTKPPGEGTGLGLSITYSIIRTLNGEITFESEINKGTKVIVTLPNNK